MTAPIELSELEISLVHLTHTHDWSLVAKMLPPNQTQAQDTLKAARGWNELQRIRGIIGANAPEPTLNSRESLHSHLSKSDITRFTSRGAGGFKRNEEGDLYLKVWAEHTSPHFLESGHDLRRLVGKGGDFNIFLNLLEGIYLNEIGSSTDFLAYTGHNVHDESYRHTVAKMLRCLDAEGYIDLGKTINKNGAQEFVFTPTDKGTWAKELFTKVYFPLVWYTRKTNEHQLSANRYRSQLRTGKLDYEKSLTTVAVYTNDPVAYGELHDHLDNSCRRRESLLRYKTRKARSIKHKRDDLIVVDAREDRSALQQLPDDKAGYLILVGDRSFGRVLVNQQGVNTVFCHPHTLGGNKLPFQTFEAIDDMRRKQDRKAKLYNS